MVVGHAARARAGRPGLNARAAAGGFRRSLSGAGFAGFSIIVRFRVEHVEGALGGADPAAE